MAKASRAIAHLLTFLPHQDKQENNMHDEEQKQDAEPVQDQTVVEETVERTEVAPAEPSTPAHEENERIHEEQADNSTVVEETSTTTTTESSSDGE
jgi:hypothetical protein